MLWLQMEGYEFILGVGFFVFGLALGSFLNVCIYRLPRGLSVVTPGSACPRCETPIRPWDNVPIVSWLVLRGRCRFCKAKITPRYLLIELATALLFLACFLKFGPTLVALKCAVLSFLLLGLIFTDAETKLLPDALTLPGIVLGLVFSLFVPVEDVLFDLLPLFSDRAWDPRLLSLLDSLLGGFTGAAFLLAARQLYYWARGVEGMGLGDVKLMAMVGTFLGLKLTIVTIFVASIAGAIAGFVAMPVVWHKRHRRWLTRGHSEEIARARAQRSAELVFRHHAMPFGVFLGTVALALLFFGHDLLRWYWYHSF